MAHEVIRQLICDQCGAVLSGFDKASQVHKDYIEIRGKISFPVFDKQSNRYTYVFITPKDVQEVLFCAGECLVGYINQKVARNKDKAIAYVRGEYRKPQFGNYEGYEGDEELAQQGIA